MPKAGIVAYLMNPSNPNLEIDNVKTAADTLGQQVLVLSASSDRELDAAFVNVSQQQVAALLVASDSLFFDRRERLVALVARQSIPAIYYLRAFPQAGGLSSYGNSLTDLYRQSGIYTGRILKGEKPADLPVMQSTKFEFVINLNTAKALGLEIPPTLLALADEVIERCRLMASKHTGRRRRPTPEITSSVLDSIRGVRHVATHNDMLRCNMGCFGCVIPARFLPVFGRFEANSKVFLHRPERRRLALA
jgi:hypothetical protein